MMEKHLIVIEHDNKSIMNTTYSAICASNKLKAHTTAVILCDNKENCATLSESIEYLVDDIIYVQDDVFSHALSQPYASTIADIVNKMNITYVWAGSSSFMKEMMPRLNARLSNSSMASDIQKIINENTFERPMWAGDIIATINMSSKIKIITVRPTEFKDEIVKLSNKSSLNKFEANAHLSKMKFISFEKIKSDRPSLSDANIVVAGGRGLKDPDNFKNIIYPLADALNAAIGASRAICDADWVPNDWQVGQTGKVVAPSLYFAIGISGAIQHVAGMRGSKTIIAINKDPEAPIFQVADYGIVGDASLIVPELTEKIKKNC
jgi:electron transfer flavoprotein alpha subunit